MLDEIGEEEIDEYMKHGKIWSESTLKKHKWVSSLYIFWCKKLNKLETFDEESIWNYDENIMFGFIKYLGIKVKYKYNTINDVIIPSLKRIHFEKYGQSISFKVSQSIKNVMKEIRRVGKDPVISKEPAILDDVINIKSYPKGFSNKYNESSLYLCLFSQVQEQ